MWGSLTTKPPVWWLRHHSESPRLWSAPIGSAIQRTERAREWENRDRQRYSLSAHTHWNEPGREKNASTQLTALFCTSTTFRAESTELPLFFSIQELLISIVDCTTCLWHWGCWSFLFVGMFWQDLAQKIRGYQEQIALLHSKCKMLTVKAKHATMLLTVSEVEGLSDGMDELNDEELPNAGSTSKQFPAHPSVVMVSGHTFSWTHPESLQGDTCTYCMAILCVVCICIILFVYSPNLPTPITLKVLSREPRSSCFWSMSVLTVYHTKL